MSGAFNFSPETYGGEANVHDTELLLEALLEADGSALAKGVDSYVWAERFAEARVLHYLWSTARRLRYQSDPERMTDFLGRWERILKITPQPGATDTERRARVAAKLAIFGQSATTDVVVSTLSAVLGSAFVSVVRTNSADATGFVPGGAVIPGGATLGDGGWYSTIAYLAIETAKGDLSDAEFYARVGLVAEILDDLLPVWVTFDWFLDGPSGAGFILDEEANLDNQRFD